MHNRKAKLKSVGGSKGEVASTIAAKTDLKNGIAVFARALKAPKGIPSGPGETHEVVEKYLPIAYPILPTDMA